MTDLEWVPQSCTLPTAERPLRVAEWDGLLAGRLTEMHRAGPLHLRLVLSGGAGVREQVRDLAGRESGCCPFFAFTTLADGTRILLDIAVDQAHEPVLDAVAERAGALMAGGRP
ncbi:hypothetical protein [Streptomyces sp. YIM 98790]|uniref:hypothetical protein n=1 Tax=Streptomyces sp. YIM 98790 TaxID=2689077 RepID=UPI00140852DD|nr:hypothetical protein [Streptomyces sp. YIM 98790]